jgi:putative peptidoglycan lipid II flippase
MTDSTVSQTASRGIAAAAFLIMAGNLLSRVLGLVREQLTSGLFGAGNEIAAFTVADNVNTLLFDLVINGMLQAALVPVLAQWAIPDKREEFRRISGALVAATAIALGALAAIGVVFAPTLVRLMTAIGGSGDARGAETTALTIDLVRIILPSIVLLGIGAVLMGSLYALERVTMPALSTGARNLFVVIALVALSGAIGIKSLPVGILIGAAVMALMQLPALKRAGALPKLNLHIRHPAVKQMLLLYWPIFLGLVVSTAAVIIDRNLAWGAEEDALGAMRYATTLVQLVMGLVGAAVSIASLPSLARHFTAGDEAAFQSTLAKALGLVTALIIPAVLGLAAIASPAVELIFRHGETTSAQAHSITIALLAYLPGHLFAAFDQVLIFSFYARQNTRTPVIIGIISTGVYFLVAFTLVDAFGMLGLVLANSAQFLAHTVIIYWLARSTFGLAHERQLWRTLARCAMAGTVMAAAAWLAWQGLDRLLPAASGATGIAREFLLVALPAGVGAAIYLVASVRLRIEEVTTLAGAVAGRLPLLARAGGRFRA